MENYLNWQDFDVVVPLSSVVARKKWRSAVSLVKNPRRRFRHVAYLAMEVDLKIKKQKILFNSIPRRAVERSLVELNGSSLESPSTEQPPIKLDELNLDCLEEIEKHLDGSSSLALAQVNRQLRTNISNMNLSGGHQPPYLMLPESSHSETCRFLRLDDNGIIELPLPAATGRKVWGSQHGWLVTMDPTLELHFLNIFSQVQEPLPPLLPMIDYIRRHATLTHLVVSNPEGKTAERSYLVASPDHLYGVFQYDDDDDDDDEDDGRTTFMVYKLNLGSLEWEALWTIEDYAFFVGNGNSLCFSPGTRVNYRRNCIYFTYDDGEKLELMLPNGGRFDFGIYDLNTWDAALRLVTVERAPSPRSHTTWIAHGFTPPNFSN